MAVTKAWYESKAMWAALLYFVLTIVEVNGWLEGLGIVIPWESIKAGLAALGLWGIRDAQGKIVLSAKGK